MIGGVEITPGMAISAQPVQPAADVDRVHDEDVWPYSTPKAL